MKKTNSSKARRLALGKLTRDTKGPGGVILESFTYMPKAGITS